jgi:uncharacterized SAM-binding protein YcdF (DUF218 family)
MLYLDKLLPLLVYPLGLSLILWLLALVLWRLGWGKWAAKLAVVAAGWLWLWSLPVVSDALRASLERQFPNQPADQADEADVIVLLGGGISPAPRDWPYPDLNRAADRIWHAARLFHAGKAPVIIVSGGLSPRETANSEADAMSQLLVDLGVPSEAIVFEDQSRTTRENAVYTARLLEARGHQRVLLVTSALHMPRALATFRAVGIEALPAATDFEVTPSSPDLRRWLPNSGSLDASTRAMKEYLGLWVYRWRGWG